MGYSRLTCHLLGNISKWVFYLGKKSIDEVAKDDNSGLGFMILLFIVLIFFAFK